MCTNSTFSASFEFFQKADVGSIMNRYLSTSEATYMNNTQERLRFNQDMDLIDMGLPMQAAQFTTGDYLASSKV